VTDKKSPLLGEKRTLERFLRKGPGREKSSVVGRNLTRAKGRKWGGGLSTFWKSRSRGDVGEAHGLSG